VTQAQWNESQFANNLNFATYDNQLPEIFILPSPYDAKPGNEDVEHSILVSTLVESSPVALEAEILTTNVDPADWIVEEDKGETVNHKVIINVDSRETSPLEELDEKFNHEFMKNFRQLWLRPRFSDYILVVGQNYFRVHKVVLGTQSPIFAMIFEERRSDIMQIPDFSVKIVNVFIRYLYTGEILKTNFMDLFAIATKYEVARLRSISEELIVNNIEFYDEMGVFNLGHSDNSEALKRCGLERIKKLFPETILDDNLLNKPELLQRMMRADRSFKRKLQETEKAEKKFELLMKRCKKSD
jgi:BTB/POZ domain